MRPQTKSVIILSIMIFAMIGVGFILNRNAGITGAVVGSDGVACYVNADCNDRISCTVDSCKNAGTQRSFCVSSPIEFCNNDDNCCPRGCNAQSDNDCS